MQPGLLSTNGGPHPADAWSAMSASHIVSMIKVEAGSTTPAARLARRSLPRFEVDLADALEKHHESFMFAERAKLATDDSRLNAAYVAHAQLDEQVAIVMDVAKKTPFAAHFADPHTQDVVRDILQNHFATVQSIERHWHCDRKLAANDHNEHVTKFHASRVAVKHDDPVSMVD